MPAYLNPLIVPSLAALVALCLTAIAFSEALAPSSRRRAVLTLGAIFAVWLPSMVWLSGTGFLDAVRFGAIPVRPLAIFGPPLLLLAALAVSPRLRRFASAMSQDWLTGIQTLRIMGGIFLLLGADRALPWEFALPAGLGDVAVGIVAMITLARLNAGAPDAAAWVRRTNVAGLADFALAVGTGVLTAPGPLQLLAFDRPNELILVYPLTLIPVFAVPVFIGAHMLSIQRQRSARPLTGGTAPAAA